LIACCSSSIPLCCTCSFDVVDMLLFSLYYI
jgi:hypothetical protein